MFSILDAIIYGTGAFSDEQLNSMAEATVDYAYDEIIGDMDDGDN